MIKNIKLKNFKVFEDEDIELAPLTLITGINGMGKSSVIQSLLLLKQSYEIGYLELKKQVDLSNDYIDLESAESLCYTMAKSRTVDVGITLDNGPGHSQNCDSSDSGSRRYSANYLRSFHDSQNLSFYKINFIIFSFNRLLSVYLKILISLSRFFFLTDYKTEKIQ